MPDKRLVIGLIAGVVVGVILICYCARAIYREKKVREDYLSRTSSQCVMLLSRSKGLRGRDRVARLCDAESEWGVIPRVIL